MMDKVNVVYMNTADLLPYANNPRVNDGAVDAVAASIKEFGFKVPIVVDADGVIVTGHTRLKAAMKLGLRQVPVIVAGDLSPEQVKAFRLADNRVAELAQWDIGKLNIELGDIADIDMGDFGFDLAAEPEKPEDGDGWYGDERERTDNAYNLGIVDFTNMTDDFWQMPVIKNDGFIPDDLIGFNYAKTSKNKHAGIHFFVDDYQFERVWNKPDAYADVLSEYECVLTPDFSLYLDMPMPTKIWNVYRSRQIGAYYQSLGLKVIPTMSWAEEATFEFCFRGVPKGSVVAVSTIGVKDDNNALRIWRDGMAEMIRQIEPSTILVYGGELDFDYGSIDVRYYDNKVTRRLKDNGRSRSI